MISALLFCIVSIYTILRTLHGNYISNRQRQINRTCAHINSSQFTQQWQTIQLCKMNCQHYHISHHVTSKLTASQMVHRDMAQVGSWQEGVAEVDHETRSEEHSQVLVQEPAAVYQSTACWTDVAATAAAEGHAGSCWNTPPCKQTIHMSL